MQFSKLNLFLKSHFFRKTSFCFHIFSYTGLLQKVEHVLLNVCRVEPQLYVMRVEYPQAAGLLYSRGGGLAHRI
jgi:hypothetical protein